MRSALAPLCLALLGLTAPMRSSGAQGTVHGTLSGTVTDPTGRAVQDAEVLLVDRASGATRRVSTTRVGAFAFSLLEPSAFDLRVEALGFRPQLLLGVSMRSGGTQRLSVRLRPALPPVVAVDTVRAGASRAAPTSWLQERGYAELVGGRRIASDAVGLSTMADESSVEGLAWRYADLAVDGQRIGQIGLPSSTGSQMTALAMPLRALSGVNVGGMGFDVEMGGSGVGLSAQSLRGGSAPSLRGAAFGGSSDYGAALLFSGPIQRDTASALFGVDYQRSEIQRPAGIRADDAEGLALIGFARDSFATNLAAYGASPLQQEERASAFSRLDWQLGDRYAVLVRGAASRYVVNDPPLLTGRGGLGSRHEATAAQLSVSALARITRRLSSEVRLSGDLAQASAEAPGLVPTQFAGAGLALGGERDEPFRDERTVPRLMGLLQWSVGGHRLKFGATFAGHRAESEGMRDAAGDYRFGDAADFAAGRGAWRGLTSGAASGNFRMVERALFVQDEWRVSDGLSMALGFRFDNHRLPTGDIEGNAAWLAQTGVDNRSVQRTQARVAPRFSFRWELGTTREWLLDGGAGVYHDLPDRRDVGEALALDRGIGVRSAVGAIAAWPGAPDSTVAPVRGQTLSLLGPGFQGPRTRRATIGLQRHVGAWSAYVRGTYRQTDFLTRRRDLNLPVSATGADQFGRPLVGTLQQVGSLLAATPGSNRRFAGFDAVHAIEVSGYSEFWAGSVGVERVLEQGLSVGVHYTYSRTEDNLATGIDPLAAVPTGISGREWSDGIADTDAPHRLVAALEFTPPSSDRVRLGLVYRLRSGTPFTAGYRDGVDANGDGVSGNDPAFVDAALPGMDALIADHPCLERSVGSFALRNDCRGPMTQRLDVRASFRIATLAGGPLDLVLDALDVLPAEWGRIDRALHLVDRAGVMTTDPVTGVTTVPVLVNPRFGTLMSDRSVGTLFRIGLRVGR